MKKNIVIMTVAAVLAIGLALAGCASPTNDTKDATNTRISAPRDVELRVGLGGWDYRDNTSGLGRVNQNITGNGSSISYSNRNNSNVGTPHLAFHFKASDSEDADGYDVAYKFYVRKKDSNTSYEIVNAAIPTNPLTSIGIQEFFPAGVGGAIYYPSVLYPTIAHSGVGAAAHPLTNGTVKLYDGTLIATNPTAATHLLNSHTTPGGDIMSYYAPNSTPVYIATGAGLATEGGQFGLPRPAFTAKPNIDQGVNINSYPKPGIYVFFKTPELVDALEGENRKVKAIRLEANTEGTQTIDSVAIPAIPKNRQRKDFTYTIVVAESTIVTAVRYGNTASPPYTNDYEPFSPNEEYQFGVQAVLNPDKYQQQTLRTDPSEIVWAGDTWKYNPKD